MFSINFEYSYFDSFLYYFKIKSSTQMLLEHIILKIYTLFGVKKNITFLELYKLTGIELCIYAYMLPDCKIKKHNYIETPNFIVFKSLISTTAIPWMFLPYKDKNKNKYIDPGFVEDIIIKHLNNDNEIYFILITDRAESNFIFNIMLRKKL